MAVHRIAGSIAPLPPLRTVKGPGKRLPGGLAPAPFRSTSHKWASGSRSNHSDGTFRGTRLEWMYDNALWDKTTGKLVRT